MSSTYKLVGFRFFRLLLMMIFICASAAGCNSDPPARKHANLNMYKITAATILDRDPNVPEGMKPIGYNAYPQAILLGKPLDEHAAPDYITIGKDIKLVRFEEGLRCKADIHDFKIGMYVKVPSYTTVYLTYPGERFPENIILSSKPIADNVLPEGEQVHRLVQPVLSLLRHSPVTALLLENMTQQNEAKEHFSGYSGDAQIVSIKKRGHQLEAEPPVNVPGADLDVLTIRDAGSENARTRAHDIIVGAANGQFTMVEKIADGKRMNGNLDQLRDGMFLRYSFDTNRAAASWLIYSDAEIPSTVLDPRIGE